MDFKPHFPYIISKIAEEPKIRGKVVIFYGWLKRPWDIRRAIVRIMNSDGSSSNEEWLVNPHILIPIR